MDCAQSRPQLGRQTAKDNANVLLADVMDSVSSRGRDGEFDAVKHVETQAG
jgi:hypothetical protein